jgi:Uma2 family endonuclease
MAIVSDPRGLTLAELTERFGPMPARRICTVPAPGTATEKDLLDLSGRGDRLWELIDGVLVEKTMGYFESRLAAVLVYLIGRFLESHDLGIVMGADAASRLAPGVVRIPDVSFLRWERLPGRKVPRDPIPELAPDLAVEVLSEGNTAKEMERKLRDYFQGGVRLVWYMDPRARTVRVYRSPDRSDLLGEDATLDGGEVLPGFTLALGEWFRRAEGGDAR